jgi:hypothetical protein
MAGRSRYSSEKQSTHARTKEKHSDRSSSQRFLTVHFGAVYKAQQEFTNASIGRLRAAKAADKRGLIAKILWIRSCEFIAHNRHSQKLLNLEN